MALEKKITFDHMIGEDGDINVRRITRVVEDGEELSKTYHRHVVEPGDEVAEQDERTQGIAGLVHTTKCVKDYKDKKEKNKWKWK
jgi:hypothetical protein